VDDRVAHEVRRHLQQERVGEVVGVDAQQRQSGIAVSGDVRGDRLQA
jgi:hypothetical protein